MKFLYKQRNIESVSVFKQTVHMDLEDFKFLVFSFWKAN